MKNALFTGIAVAMVTPFTDRGIDFDTLGILIDRQLEAGIDAVVTLGTTGEPSVMTQSECESVVDFTVRHVNGRAYVIAGAGDNDTYRAAEKSKMFRDLGADALLIVTPYYNKATQDGLIEHFTVIADAAKVPVILYNVPARTGVNMLPGTVSVLSKHPHIAGLKEADSSIVQLGEDVWLCGEDFKIYAGNDEMTIAALAVGAQGIISVSANVWPTQVKAIADQFFCGELDLARRSAQKIAKLNQLLFREVSPIPTKAALCLMGFGQEYMRLPLTKATKSLQAELLSELTQLKLV